MGLRLGTLASKMLLTLYMGKYFSLGDLGIYGLVFGAVMVIGGIAGLRIDYVVSREIVGIPPDQVLLKMRDQMVFYCLNYVVLAILMMLVSLIGVDGITNRVMLYIFILSVLEGFAAASYNNMNSLEQQVMGNFLFFFRSGAWTFPVMIAGFVSPRFQNIDVVMMGWIGGVAVSLLGTLYVWRHLPWREVVRTPVNREWIRQCIRRCFLIWLGGLGIVAGYYVDRIIVLKFLGIDKVGIATFYLSFTNALLTLLISGVLSLAYPRLIKLYRNADRNGFSREIRQMVINVNCFAFCIAITMGVAVPLLGKWFNRPEIVHEAFTFWLMLAGTFLRANTEAMYFILFARHQDRAIWLGNLLFLIPALGGNLLLVPLCGLKGIGYSSILAALFLLLWRLWHVRYPAKTVHVADSNEMTGEEEMI